MKKLFLLGLVPLFGIGCSQGIAERVTERAVNNALDGKGKVNIQDGNVNFKDEKTGATANYGANVEIPSDFPADVLRYPDATITGVTNVPNQGSQLVLSTQDSAEKILAWYESQYTGQGFTREADLNMGGQRTRAYAKGTDRVSVLVTTAGDVQTIMVIKSNQ